MYINKEIDIYLIKYVLRSVFRVDEKKILIQYFLKVSIIVKNMLLEFRWIQVKIYTVHLL